MSHPAGAKRLEVAVRIQLVHGLAQLLVVQYVIGLLFISVAGFRPLDFGQLSPLQ